MVLSWAMDCQMIWQKCAGTTTDRKIPEKSLTCSRGAEPPPIWKQNPGYPTNRDNIKAEADYSLEQILMSWKTRWCFQAK